MTWRYLVWIVILTAPALASADAPSTQKPIGSFAPRAEPSPNLRAKPSLVISPGLSGLADAQRSAERQVATGVVLGGLAVCSGIAGILLVKSGLTREPVHRGGGIALPPPSYEEQRARDKAGSQVTLGLGLLAVTTAGALGSAMLIDSGRGRLAEIDRRRHQLSIAPMPGGASAMVSGTF